MSPSPQEWKQEKILHIIVNSVLKNQWQDLDLGNLNDTQAKEHEGTSKYLTKKPVPIRLVSYAASISLCNYDI